MNCGKSNLNTTTPLKNVYTINIYSFQKKGLGKKRENDDSVIQYIYEITNCNVEYFIVEI